MSCPCDISAIKMEWASSGPVQAVACSGFTDNNGYDGPTGYVPAGSGHSDRLFGKQITTYHFTLGTYWESADYSTDIFLSDGLTSCPTVVNDTNYDPAFNYGTATAPYGSHTTLTFENPILNSDLMDYALAHSPYGSYAVYDLSNPVTFYDGGEPIVTAQDAQTAFELGNTVKRTDLSGGYVLEASFVTKYQFRASLAGAKMPVKVKYDFWNVTDSAAHSTDNEFTLNDDTPEQEIEIPLVEDKEIRLKNVRFFFCPFHL